MTVQKDLEKVLAYCEAIKGNYSIMAFSTEEEQTKQVFNRMKTDIEKHIGFLNERLEYLSQNNTLNDKG